MNKNPIKEYIEARGGIGELAEEEKSALVVIEARQAKNPFAIKYLSGPKKGRVIATYPYESMGRRELGLLFKFSKDRNDGKHAGLVDPKGRVLFHGEKSLVAHEEDKKKKTAMIYLKIRNDEARAYRDMQNRIDAERDFQRAP